jgi:flagellar biosynthetic protein FliP
MTLGSNFSCRKRCTWQLSILVIILLTLCWASTALAKDISLPGVDIHLGNAGTGKTEIATAIKILLGMTVLSLAPGSLIATPSFTRIVIVLSMLRHAFGMQQTPPNTVIVSLALLLTVFNMAPVFQKVQTEALQPYLNGQLKEGEALQRGLSPLRDFMVHQTREEDLMLMVDISKGKRPKTINDIKLFQLIPAFMLSELNSAFQIGFVIFLPFLLIDFVVASVLMSMGMLMVPPMMISLPIKILMFVLIDGWNLVVYSLLHSFK